MRVTGCITFHLKKYIKVGISFYHLSLSLSFLYQSSSCKSCSYNMSPVSHHHHNNMTIYYNQQQAQQQVQQQAYHFHRQQHHNSEYIQQMWVSSYTELIILFISIAFLIALKSISQFLRKTWANSSTTGTCSKFLWWLWILSCTMFLRGTWASWSCSTTSVTSVFTKHLSFHVLCVFFRKYNTSKI